MCIYQALNLLQQEITFGTVVLANEELPARTTSGINSCLVKRHSLHPLQQGEKWKLTAHYCSEVLARCEQAAHMHINQLLVPEPSETHLCQAKRAGQQEVFEETCQSPIKSHNLKALEGCSSRYIASKDCAARHNPELNQGDGIKMLRCQEIIERHVKEKNNVKRKRVGVKGL